MNKEFKTYKEFINESQGFDQSRFPLTDPQEVKQWIQEHSDKFSNKWSVDNEGHVSCTGNINLSKMNLTKLPFKIKSIGGDLICYNNRLTSFKGLESFEFIGGDLICYNNRLTSFKGLESFESIGGDFWCYNNKLLSKKVPFKVKGKIYFEVYEVPYIYEDSVEYLVSLNKEEQKKIIEDLMEFDSQAYRKLLTYSEENNIELPISQEAYKWNKKANDLENTGLEF